ncbi:hypothetical protein HanLR1_Chr06g0201951 [Helianthus annuus]|nr:hypothetical protein HanLR1_Chr06g0201951 [Helianthus annuus]
MPPPPSRVQLQQSAKPPSRTSRRFLKWHVREVMSVYMSYEI